MASISWARANASSVANPESENCFPSAGRIARLEPQGVVSACVEDRRDRVVLHAWQSVPTHAGRWQWRRLYRKRTITWINEFRPPWAGDSWTNLIRR